MRLALFITCVNDLVYPATGEAVVRLLRRLGHAVEFPGAQTCCGQLHANSGYRDEALPLVRHYAEVFAPYDAVVTPSGSCAAMVREWYPRLVPEAADVAARTYELSELLTDVLGVTDTGASYPHRVAYHPTCHGMRVLGLGERPLRLLRAVRGIDLVPLPGAEECCGFGGTFALKNAGVSAAMLADKCRAAESTGADVLAAADNSCLAHIGGGLSRAGSGLRTVHYAEILAAGEGS
ncbi:Fe-S oxidoreductase [Actinorhabdospora filicis]|uniref:Fe-S oxidoreductase n=1 Tax=Actinorhabdospora filicis TaxID=1785913 RepID=A0A9W6SS60_9ACTN|nr:(Fe-S)-binding protein [Actinorhabdospora filicis]GLZ79766.1 Fe-S oxidoreductase [Actinorhabdospora filicis]